MLYTCRFTLLKSLVKPMHLLGDVYSCLRFVASKKAQSMFVKCKSFLVTIYFLAKFKLPILVINLWHYTSASECIGKQFNILKSYIRIKKKR
jgi:hypothetical protein